MIDKKAAFTLAEVLITLAIIGVVAAVSIPSVISNSQQQEFKTGLRKAVSVLNSAITMNMALDGESPYDNANLMGYLMKHMAIMRSTTDLGVYFGTPNNMRNAGFYTTDGMRFEFRHGTAKAANHKLYESNVAVCTYSTADTGINTPDMAEQNRAYCNGCGSLGLNNNPDETTKPPCMMMVDVNGDRKPNPANVNCNRGSSTGGITQCAENEYKFSDPLGLKLTDLFTIIITDKQAIPYGVAAQRAMYQARK
ncbi:MAG: type II secretion system protein [bacterium]|nr:type II secretion system protein [bacterium]